MGSAYRNSAIGYVVPKQRSWLLMSCSGCFDGACIVAERNTLVAASTRSKAADWLDKAVLESTGGIEPVRTGPLACTTMI